MKGSIGVMEIILLLLVLSVIVLPAVLIPVLIVSGKRKRAAAIPQKATLEYTRVCRDCGHVFTYTDLDLARHKGIAAELNRCPACHSDNTAHGDCLPLGES